MKLIHSLGVKVKRIEGIWINVLFDKDGWVKKFLMSSALISALVISACGGGNPSAPAAGTGTASSAQRLTATASYATFYNTSSDTDIQTVVAKYNVIIGDALNSAG